MFCLRVIGDDNNDDRSDTEDEFGWWLSERREILAKPRRSREEFDASTSPGTDGHASRVLGENFASSTPAAATLDVDLIERDARDAEATETKSGTLTLAITRTDCDGRTSSNAVETEVTRRLEGACYTPERLVKSQEYRILAPQPRYLCVSITRNPGNGEPLKQPEHGCRRKLDYTADNTGSNPQPNSLDTGASTVSSPSSSSLSCESTNGQDDLPPSPDGRYVDRIGPCATVGDFLERLKSERNGRDVPTAIDESKCRGRRTESFPSNGAKLRRRPLGSGSFLEDARSRGRRHDWSSVAHRDARTDSNHLCLCEELAMAARNGNCYEAVTGKNLQVCHDLRQDCSQEIDPLDLTSEEDRFGRVSSTHDSLARLALAIETDGSASEYENETDGFVRQFRERLDGLRITSEDICKDVTTLREDFQGDEEKLTHLLAETTKLRQSVDEVRYLDDLLKLLEGEVDRIAQQNWPFMLGRREFQPEEVNLVV